MFSYSSTLSVIKERLSTMNPNPYAVKANRLCRALLLAAAVAGSLFPGTTHGFELRIYNATSRNGGVGNGVGRLLMAPLNLDEALPRRRGGVSISAASSSSGGENLQRPRGIVLNAAVGGLTFTGGLIGFLAKGSKASLISGSTIGGLLLLSAYLISRAGSSSSPSAKGNALGFTINGLLFYMMSKKFAASKKFFPPGLLSFLSGMGVVYNLVEAKHILSSSSKTDPEEGGGDD